MGLPRRDTPSQQRRSQHYPCKVRGLSKLRGVIHEIEAERQWHVSQYSSIRILGCEFAPNRSQKSTPSCGKLVADMFETMYAAPGIGLAATQVNVHKRILVCDVSRRRASEPLLPDQPRNHRAPKARRTPRKAACPCRSSTTTSTAPRRSGSGRSTATGKPFELEAEGLLAVCIQHEMDHLEGKLFVDYLSELKRERLKKKAAKKAKRAATDGASAREPQSVPVDLTRGRRRAELVSVSAASRSPGPRSSRCPALRRARRVGRRRAARADAARPPGRPRPPAHGIARQASRRLAHGLRVAQPQTLRRPRRCSTTLGPRPDLMVVVAYGLLLPRAMLAWPRLGCVNLHASLLPRWRGAAPIQRAILARRRDDRRQRHADGARARHRARLLAALDADRRARNGRRAARPARGARGAQRTRATRCRACSPASSVADAAARRARDATRRRSRRRRPLLDWRARRARARRAACARSIRGPSPRRASTTARRLRVWRRRAVVDAQAAARARHDRRRGRAPASTSRRAHGVLAATRSPTAVGTRRWTRRRISPRIRSTAPRSSRSARAAGRRSARRGGAARRARAARAHRAPTTRSLPASRTSRSAIGRCSRALVFGALRWHHRLEWQAARLLTRPLEARASSSSRALLRRRAAAAAGAADSGARGGVGDGRRGRAARPRATRRRS